MVVCAYIVQQLTYDCLYYTVRTVYCTATYIRLPILYSTVQYSSCWGHRMERYLSPGVL